MIVGINGALPAVYDFESDELFRQLIDNSAVATAILSPEGRFVYVNAALCEVSGYDAETLKRANFLDFTSVEDRPEALRMHGEMLADRIQTYRRRTHVMQADGTPAWGDLSSSCVRNPDRSVRWVISQIVDVTEQVLARRKLKRLTEIAERERERLHATFDSLFDPLVLFQAARDAEGRIVDLVFMDANAAACEFEHEPHDALVGASILERHSAGRTTGLYDLFARVVETGEPLVLNDYIYPLESLAGEERRFDIRGAHVGDGLVLTWRDVTARYEAAERIANSERRLRVVLDNLLDSHVMLRAVRDESGQIVDFTFAEVNLAASAFSGEPRNAIVGTRVLDGGGLGVGPEVFALLVDVLETGEPLVLDDYTEIDNPAHAGHYFDMRAVRTGDAISLMFRDVTERHVAARALAESEERLRLAIANSPIGIGLLTPDGRYFTANPAMCEMLGRDFQTVTSLSFRDMTHPDDVARDSARFEDLVHDRIPNFRVRKRYLRPDGSLV